MESIKKRNSFIKHISYTYDNTQRLIKNSIGSLKRFNDLSFAQKLKRLFIHERKTYLWTGFFIFGAILVINVIIMTFYLSDSGYNYNLMKNSFVNAVLPSQDTTGAMDLGIVKVAEPIYADLSIGDQVVIYSDFSLDVYFVETVVSIDNQTKTIELTYDNIISNGYHISDIVGTYSENANFLGTIYYASMFIRGYIFIALSHLILLVGYWYTFLKTNSKEKSSFVPSYYYEEQNSISSIVQEIALEQKNLNRTGIGVLVPPVLPKSIPLDNAKPIVVPDFTRSKGDIIEYITRTTGLSNYQGKTFLKYFAKVISEELAKGEYVHIVNFGKFTTVNMPAKAAVDPRTKKKIIVPEHKQARFKFYDEVKSKIE
jgi:nucleoid DNA-binding protein